MRRLLRDDRQGRKLKLLRGIRREYRRLGQRKRPLMVFVVAQQRSGSRHDRGLERRQQRERRPGVEDIGRGDDGACGVVRRRLPLERHQTVVYKIAPEAPEALRSLEQGERGRGAIRGRHSRPLIL